MLKQWLSINWDRPERSYLPELRDFLSELLEYPKNKIITEDKGPDGFPDLKLLTPEGIPWVVGDLKKDDEFLTISSKRQDLWKEKRKYVSGLTRYVLFLTPHFVWVTLPDGTSAPGFDKELNLRDVDISSLRSRLHFLSYNVAAHEKQWQEFIEGKLPYNYLKLDTPETLTQIRQDLQQSFEELSQVAENVMRRLQSSYQDYLDRQKEIRRNLQGETRNRALVHLDLSFRFERWLFEEAFRQFEEHYGRELDVQKKEDAEKRIREAFVADSVAALIARVLFLRLIEDLGLARRRLSNGGPRDWASFVESLASKAQDLVQLVAKDISAIYKEPFSHTIFEWVQNTNGDIDQALQRLILRLNAYDFSGLSEEILGNIYQEFLPPSKRKRLGEYYTPASIVEWILDHTVRQHGVGKLLDPACGSGSFLVRYAHWRFEDARHRGLKPQEVCQNVLEEVWGFDINPFAAFISHFQLMWAVLRFLKNSGVQLKESPKISIYNLNSLIKDSDIAQYLNEKHLPAGAKDRDQRKWKYVLGNPPYIRAERVKYGEEMRGLWQEVWGQNADTGLIFLYRALTEWLDKNGYLGMVVSGGYASSEAAAKVWKLLHPQRQAALRKLVWLEFVEENGKPKQVWNVAPIPLILIIERTPAREDDEIELYVPSQWPSGEPPIKVRYADFFDLRINPKVTHNQSNYGDYLLPLLQPHDVSILRKLYPNGKDFTELKEVLVKRIRRNKQPYWWTYGIQRGGVEVTSTSTSKKSIQVIAGRDLAVAWPGEPVGYVDLEAVATRQYGKLSLWGEEPYPEQFIAVVNICRAPTASLIEAPNRNLASLDTTIVSQCKENLNPKAVVAYLNSKLTRFYWAIRLRSGVLQGYYAHVYPRSLEILPWPKHLCHDLEEQLAGSYDQLAKIAARAQNNPNEWLLAEAENYISKNDYIKLSDPSLALDFRSWIDDVSVEELTWDENYAIIRAGLFSLEFPNADLAAYVYHVLTLTADEDQIISKEHIQKLLVPEKYQDLIQEYRKRLEDFQAIEKDFMEALAQVDCLVYKAFGITRQEQDYIEQRLGSFPLNRLKPRYPWESVRPRPIKAYTEDRFA